MSDKKPQAGEWWEDPGGKRLYCVGAELGGWPVIQRNNGLVYSTLGPAWKGRKLDGCTGWDWEEPEPETFPQWYVSGKMCGWGLTAYVVRDTATTYFCVETNGKETRNACFTWDQSLVASGAWKQTTQAEAESLVTKPPLPQEPPKPNYVRLWTHRTSGTVCSATDAKYLAYPEIWTEVKHDGTGFYLAACQGAMRIVSLWNGREVPEDHEHAEEMKALCMMQEAFIEAIAKAEGRECIKTFDCNAGDHSDCCPATGNSIG